MCFQCVNPDHLSTVEMQEAQQWIEEHQGQLKAGEAGDSAQGGPSEDRVDLGQDFDTLSNNQLSKEDPFFIWLSNGNFSDSECLWPAIEGWGCGRGRLVACRGGGGRWKVAAGSRKDTWLQHLDQFTVSYSGEMDLFSFHVRIYLALLLWDAICSVHLGWCQVIFGWGWVETCNQRPEIHQIVPYCCPLLPEKNA